MLLWHHMPPAACQLLLHRLHHHSHHVHSHLDIFMIQCTVLLVSSSVCYHVARQHAYVMHTTPYSHSELLRLLSHHLNHSHSHGLHSPHHLVHHHASLSCTTHTAASSSLRCCSCFFFSSHPLLFPFFFTICITQSVLPPHPYFVTITITVTTSSASSASSSVGRHGTCCCR